MVKVQITTTNKTEKMDKVKVAKIIGGIIVSIGVGAIVDNEIKASTPTSMGLFKKVCVMAGAFVIGGMITDKAIKYTEESIDKTVAQVKKIINDVKVEASTVSK